jgi:AcrR family transcriptional regulator
MREELRDVILDAADRLLARYGYRKMTVDDLAKEAGIGKGTVYLFFPSKQEVALCWIDRKIQRLVARLRAVAAGDGSAAERIREMLLTRVMTLFDGAQEHYHMYDDLFGSIRAAYMPRRQMYLDWETGVFADVLREGAAAGELVVDDARNTARSLLLTTQAILPYSLTTRELGARDEVCHSAERIADLVLNGLRRRD